MSNIFGQLWDNTAGGMLWKPIKHATGLTDAQMAGIAALAVAAPFAAPMLASGGAAAPMLASGGAAAPAAGWEAYAKPAMTAMQGASMAKGLLGPEQSQPVQAAPMQHQQANFSGLLSPDTTAQDAERRKQQQAMVMQGLLGGAYRG